MCVCRLALDREFRARGWVGCPCLCCSHVKAAEGGKLVHGAVQHMELEESGWLAGWLVVCVGDSICERPELLLVPQERNSFASYSD